MANLRGGTFEKQIKDALYRLDAQGESRYLKEDHLTHSSALWEKREMYLRDFANWVKENELSGKLNTLMTEENIRAFLDERLADVSPKTALDYTSGFNSMLKGLEEVRVTIPANLQNDFLKDFREVFREQIHMQDVITNRAIENVDLKLQELYNTRFESGVIAEVQRELGFRVNEAMEVVKNFDKYYNPQNGTIEGVIGKGGQEYMPKPIGEELVNKIQQVEHTTHYNTYLQDLKSVGIEHSHDLRYTYAKESFMEKISSGMDYKQTLREVSEEINHHRESMTQYYLARA